MLKINRSVANYSFVILVNFQNMIRLLGVLVIINQKLIYKVKQKK